MVILNNKKCLFDLQIIIRNITLYKENYFPPFDSFTSQFNCYNLPTLTISIDSCDEDIQFEDRPNEIKYILNKGKSLKFVENYNVLTNRLQSPVYLSLVKHAPEKFFIQTHAFKKIYFKRLTHHCGDGLFTIAESDGGGELKTFQDEMVGKIAYLMRIVCYGEVSLSCAQQEIQKRRKIEAYEFIKKSIDDKDDDEKEEKFGINESFRKNALMSQIKMLKNVGNPVNDKNKNENFEHNPKKKQKPLTNVSFEKPNKLIKNPKRTTNNKNKYSKADSSICPRLTEVLTELLMLVKNRDDGGGVGSSDDGGSNSGDNVYGDDNSNHSDTMEVIGKSHRLKEQHNTTMQRSCDDDRLYNETFTINDDSNENNRKNNSNRKNKPINTRKTKNKLFPKYSLDGPCNENDNELIGSNDKSYNTKMNKYFLSDKKKNNNNNNSIKNNNTNNNNKTTLKSSVPAKLRSSTEDHYSVSKYGGSGVCGGSTRGKSLYSGNEIRGNNNNNNNNNNSNNINNNIENDKLKEAMVIGDKKYLKNSFINTRGVSTANGNNDGGENGITNNNINNNGNDHDKNKNKNNDNNKNNSDKNIKNNNEDTDVLISTVGDDDDIKKLIEVLEENIRDSNDTINNETIENNNNNGTMDNTINKNLDNKSDNNNEKTGYKNDNNNDADYALTGDVPNLRCIVDKYSDDDDDDEDEGSRDDDGEDGGDDNACVNPEYYNKNNNNNNINININKIEEKDDEEGNGDGYDDDDFETESGSGTGNKISTTNNINNNFISNSNNNINNNNDNNNNNNSTNNTKNKNNKNNNNNDNNKSNNNRNRNSDNSGFNDIQIRYSVSDDESIKGDYSIQISSVDDNKNNNNNKKNKNNHLKNDNNSTNSYSSDNSICSYSSNRYKKNTSNYNSDKNSNTNSNNSSSSSISSSHSSSGSSSSSYSSSSSSSYSSSSKEYKLKRATKTTKLSASLAMQPSLKNVPEKEDDEEDDGAYDNDHRLNEREINNYSRNGDNFEFNNKNNHNKNSNEKHYENNKNNNNNNNSISNDGDKYEFLDRISLFDSTLLQTTKSVSFFNTDNVFIDDNDDNNNNNNNNYNNNHNNKSLGDSSDNTLTNSSRNGKIITKKSISGLKGRISGKNIIGAKGEVGDEGNGGGGNGGRTNNVVNIMQRSSSKVFDVSAMTEDLIQKINFNKKNNNNNNNTLFFKNGSNEGDDKEKIKNKNEGKNGINEDTDINADSSISECLYSSHDFIADDEEE